MTASVIQVLAGQPSLATSSKPAFGSPEWLLFIVIFVAIIAVLVAVLTGGVRQKGKSQTPNPRTRR